MNTTVATILVVLMLVSVSLGAQDCVTIERRDVMQVWAVRRGAALCTFNASNQTYNNFNLKVNNSLSYNTNQRDWYPLERAWRTISSQDGRLFSVFRYSNGGTPA